MRRLRCISPAKSRDHCMYHGSSSAACSGGNTLPLIPQQTDHLRGCTLFTKFNIRWGYNAVWIKKGHEWKVAFTTNNRLYEPTVMFFGLCNSPTTFQSMINTLFCNQIASGELTIYMDDMAMHTSPKE